MSQSEVDPEESTVASPCVATAELMAAETRTAAGGAARALAATGLPAKVGRYVVVGKLGEGGMGVVYEATDPELKRRVAVKVVRGRGVVGAGQGALLREAQAMAQLSHPSVVPVFDVGTVDETGGGGVFIAMELVEGQTLRDWLKAARRPWKDVVKVLVAAGRGLAAAHAAGIVHRDFKPANVLVGMDGRVRVTDFGLARVDDAVLGPDEAGEAGGVAGLTMRTAGVAGTPGYVAPEALDGVVDARGDQFAFCVSLYEALYGERPFTAGTGSGRSPLIELAEEVRRGAVKPAPRGARVPGWLRAIVVRGLSPEPDRRWPTLAALLDEIERVPRRRSRLVVSVVAVSVGLVAIAGFVEAGGGDARIDCRRADDALDGIWTPRRRASLLRAFSQTGPEGDAEGRATVEALDSYGERWRAARIDACVATHVRGEQSAAVLDVRMGCLDRRLDEIDALVAVLEHGGPSTVARARHAVASVAGADTCGAAQAMDVVPLPVDPRVEELRSLLADANAQLVAGDHELARRATQRAVELATALGHPGLRAEARWLYGELFDVFGVEAAVAELRLALADAAAARDVSLEARVAVALLKRSIEVGSADAAAALLPMVRATASKVQDSPSLEAELAQVEAFVLDRTGRDVEAIDACNRIDELPEPERARRDECLCGLTSNVSSEQTRERCRAAVASAERDLGRNHPRTGVLLERLGNVENRLGNYDAALEIRRRVLAISLTSSGPDSVDEAASLMAIGGTLVNLARSAEAIDYLERALTIAHKNDARFLELMILNIVSSAYFDVGAVDRGLAAATSQLDMASEILGPENPEIVGYLLGHAEAHMRAGKVDVAVASFEKVAAVAGAMGDEGQLFVGLGSMGAAQALTELGRHEEAIASARRAVSALDAVATDPHNRASARMVLGFALSGAAQPDLARRELELARSMLVALGDFTRADVERVDAELSRLGRRR